MTGAAISRREKFLTGAYIAVLALMLILPVGYVFLVPDSLDEQLFAGLRTLMFRLEELKVEKAASLIQSGDEEGAERELQKYLAAKGNVGRLTYASASVGDALELLSNLYERQGRYKRCLAVRSQLFELHPNDYYYALLLGVAHENQGEMETALKYYRKSFRLEPSHPMVQTRYLGLLGELSRTVDLVEAYDYYLRLRKRNTPVVNVRYSVAPSATAIRVMRLLNLPAMAPPRDNADVRWEDRDKVVIPLGPVESEVQRHLDLLLWGKIYNVPEPLSILGAKIHFPDGEVDDLPAGQLTLARSKHSLQYEFSLVLRDYKGTPHAIELKLGWDECGALDKQLRTRITRAYLDRARNVPLELLKEGHTCSERDS